MALGGAMNGSVISWTYLPSLPSAIRSWGSQKSSVSRRRLRRLMTEANPSTDRTFSKSTGRMLSPSTRPI